MFKWFDQLFANPRIEIRVVRTYGGRPALHIAFMRSVPGVARGALLTSENPEILLEQLRAIGNACRELDLVIHGAHHAPLSARRLGAWLDALSTECGISSIVIVVEESQDIRAALETARRRGCAIAGL